MNVLEGARNGCDTGCGPAAIHRFISDTSQRPARMRFGRDNRQPPRIAKPKPVTDLAAHAAIFRYVKQSHGTCSAIPRTPARYPARHVLTICNPILPETATQVFVFVPSR